MMPPQIAAALITVAIVFVPLSIWAAVLHFKDKQMSFFKGKKGSSNERMEYVHVPTWGAGTTWTAGYDFGIPSSGGHRGGAQAHRTGAVGGASNSTSNAPGSGASTRMSIGEFDGKAVLNSPELEEVGFSAGVVRGVRSFRVDKLGRLTGVHHKQVWTPGENEATCRAQAPDYHYAVYDAAIAKFLGQPVTEPKDKYRADAHAMTDCKHGFYAYYDGSDDYSDTGMVSAVIEGYGETVIGTRGFRCMKARIVAITFRDDVPQHLAAKVKRNYPDIPVMDSFDDMVTVFPPDSAGNEYTPDTDPDFWTRSI